MKLTLGVNIMSFSHCPEKGKLELHLLVDFSMCWELMVMDTRTMYLMGREYASNRDAIHRGSGKGVMLFLVSGGHLSVLLWSVPLNDFQLL